MDTEYEVGVTQYYRISAIDHSGNMGEFSPTRQFSGHTPADKKAKAEEDAGKKEDKK